MNIIAATAVGDTFTFTPTITASLAYSSQFRFGSIVELTNFFTPFAKAKPQMGVPINNQQLRFLGSAELRSCTVIDQANASQPYTLWIFDSLPTVASADRTALSIVDGESSKLMAIVDVDNPYSSVTNWSAQTKGNLGIQVRQSAQATSQSAWVVIQIKGTATFASTTDVTFKLSVFQD